MLPSYPITQIPYPPRVCSATLLFIPLRASTGVATIAYNLIEAIVAITAGTVASSAALIGFGLDSTIEVLSAPPSPGSSPAATPSAGRRARCALSPWRSSPSPPTSPPSRCSRSWARSTCSTPRSESCSPRSASSSCRSSRWRSAALATELDDLNVNPAGSFGDVEQALRQGLIDDDVFDEVADRIDARSTTA